jgi:hypothetical protein
LIEAQEGVMTNKTTARIIAGLVCACALFAAQANAQTTTTSTRTVKFEVISVNGNQLVVKLPEGTREMTVPDTTRFNVDGKDMSVRDLKPGMAGEATITTTTTMKPVYVTEARNVKVMQANGNSVIIRDAQNGFKLITQEDIDKYHVQIMRNGQPIELQQLKAQDTISATFVTTTQETMTEQQVNARLAQAASAVGSATKAAASAVGSAAKTAGAAVGTAASSMAAAASPSSAASPASAAEAPKTLPKTASPLPMIGLVGLVLLAFGAILTMTRRRFNN